MRQLYKYKHFNNLDFIAKFPVKVLKFKRPKWHRLQEQYRSKSLLGKELVDITSVKNEFKAWEKVSSSYKTRLKDYSFISASLNNSINLKKLKKSSSITSRKERFANLYFQNYYKVCTLTWLAHFLTSTVEARQQIHSKKVTVNNRIPSQNAILVKGDILSWTDTQYNFLTITQKYNKNISFLTHVDIDYYSQDIVLVKDLVDLSEEDYFLLSLDYINLQTLR